MSRKTEALLHYGYSIFMGTSAVPNTGVGVWDKADAFKRLAAIADFMKFVDDKQKVRITFEYDPDYPTALLITEATLKL